MGMLGRPVVVGDGSESDRWYPSIEEAARAENYSVSRLKRALATKDGYIAGTAPAVYIDYEACQTSRKERTTAYYRQKEGQEEALPSGTRPEEG